MVTANFLSSSSAIVANGWFTITILSFTQLVSAIKESFNVAVVSITLFTAAIAVVLFLSKEEIDQIKP